MPAIRRDCCALGGFEGFHLSLAVIILTFNESRHIARAIDSVAAIASDIVVVDSGSIDDTVTIAAARGARVLTHPFVNQAQQFQWALDHAGIETDWVMRLDADEVIEPDLAQEISTRLPDLPAEVTGVTLDRKHVFMGKWIRHGGRYPLTLLRIWRRGKAKIENRWMDEHIYLLEGRSIGFAGGFADINLNDLTFFTEKHNRYATREAVEVLNQRHGLFAADERTLGDLPQARRKRALKEKVYNRLPFGVGPALYFIFRYVFQLGFLDGVEGAIYHGLQGFWYRALVDAKIVELERQIRDLPTPAEKLDRLRGLTGLSL